MVGAVSIIGSVVVDSHTCPCLCLDALSSSGMNFMSTGDLRLLRNFTGRKQLNSRPGSLELSSSFLDAGHDWRLSAKVLSRFVNGQHSKKQNKGRSLVIFNELGGQYEDTFEDVKTQLLNYFTYKAVRTVLTQLYEMNPTQYRWFYDLSPEDLICVLLASGSFVATNQPADGKRFIRILGKEKRDLAERVMVTRLHLYGKWIKKCDHAAIYKEISDQNLELMRERLIETVIWPSDDTNTEKIG